MTPPSTSRRLRGTCHPSEACLLDLSAGLSKSPAELVPVRPVLEFNMVDPRFVEEEDVLSGLDQRPT
jgi:restriction system protein